MSYHPRIESRRIASLVTVRTRNSELWFANNSKLEEAMLGYAAKYRERYKVALYALAFEGSHLHHAAHYPEANRANFTRDFHSTVARAVERYSDEYPGGKLFARRYSGEFLPGPDDIEEYFFYIVLQPVQDGLVSKVSEYPFYNCFHDAVYGITRKYKVIDWAAYNVARRYGAAVSIRDYTTYHELRFKRLPGYEDMPRAEYIKLMQEKLHRREEEIVAARHAKGKGFVGRERLLKTVPGTPAKNPKVSSRYAHRPRVLCVCAVRRHQYLRWYFAKYRSYRSASAAYRDGETDIKFPDGMYKPFLRGPPPRDSEGVEAFV